MREFVFITGNQNKADYLSRYLGYPVEHVKVDLDEIQTLKLEDIVRHKVRQAYAVVGRPVVVEDVSLECDGLNGLPGPFIKWFLDALKPEGICHLLDTRNRSAAVRCVVGYFDGTVEKYFESSSRGKIAEKPHEGIGYGFDPFFIHDGFDVPRSGMNQEDHDRTYFEFKPFGKLKEWLETETSRA